MLPFLITLHCVPKLARPFLQFDVVLAFLQQVEKYLASDMRKFTTFACCYFHRHLMLLLRWEGQQNIDLFPTSFCAIFYYYFRAKLV